MDIQSKLPKAGTSIFAIMSALSNEHQAINLGQGFPDFDCDEKLRILVSKYLNDGKNQYCPMPGFLGLRQSISDKMFRSYNTRLDPASQICVTAGATQALFTAITAFVNHGDEVIIFEPAYDSYAPTIQIAGGIPKPYRLTLPDYRVDWDRVESMITDRTRMIMINTPHNPTGTILKKEDLLALERIVANTNIIVVSDEVYEHLIYDEEEHQSVIRFPNLFQQSMAIYSFGKTFHSTGWKMGYCIGPDHLIKEFKNVHQWNVFSVNSFTQYALAEHLQDPQSYETLPLFFQQKRDFLNEALKEVPLKPQLSKGTYFQLFNYEKISDQNDLDFAKYMTTEIGVASIPLSPFYTDPPGDKVIRLCFAKKESTLSSAAERLSKLI